MKKQLFEIGDMVDYDGLEYVIVDIDNESNTEPIITLKRNGESFNVREHELL